MDRQPLAKRTPSLIWDALKTASLPILCYDLVLLRPWPFPGEEAGGAVTQILFLTIVIGGVLAGYCLHFGRITGNYHLETTGSLPESYCHLKH